MESSSSSSQPCVGRTTSARDNSIILLQSDKDSKINFFATAIHDTTLYGAIEYFPANSQRVVTFLGLALAQEN